jgi:hypothetical protein
MKQKHKNKLPKLVQSLYAAVDLHGDNGFYCIINPLDQVKYSKRLPNHLPTILEALAPFKPHLAQGIAVESTFNWYWLVDGLQDHGYTVQLVNPAQIDSSGALKNTNDRSDAFWLAHLQRLGILPTGYIYPKAQRGVRDLLLRPWHRLHSVASDFGVWRGAREGASPGRAVTERATTPDAKSAATRRAEGLLPQGFVARSSRIVRDTSRRSRLALGQASSRQSVVYATV